MAGGVAAAGLLLPPGAPPAAALPAKVAAGALCYGAALAPFARRRRPGRPAARPI
jgi:hypothetical protein